VTVNCLFNLLLLMLSMQYLQDTCNKNVSNEIEKSQQHLKHGIRVSLELVFDS